MRVTYCAPGGQPGGVAVETLGGGAELGFHWLGLTNMSSGMMGSGGSSSSSGAYRHDRASAFTFLGPGR